MPSIVDLLLDTARADTELLFKNDALGDVHATPREVDFLIRAPDPEKAELIASFINDNRYGSARAESDEGESRVMVVIEMPITQNVICSVSGLMACVARIFGAEYDGWGSVICPRGRPVE
ncbi:MAG: ribonuclease E inhibitor RraB [Phycisphaerae bacterium]|nr:ribonuclease E inhibitor RraB [Tepidisphaeraceae bacterium]